MSEEDKVGVSASECCVMWEPVQKLLLWCRLKNKKIMKSRQLRQLDSGQQAGEVSKLGIAFLFVVSKRGPAPVTSER